MNPSSEASTLPELTSEQRLHRDAVNAAILRRIEARQGSIPFDEFMELALYAPGLGYYSAGGVKIGAAGDFITAPELSDLYSGCVANQIAQVLTDVGGSILELGAGTGRMAATILESLARSGTLPERYAILEVSADLRERQERRIQGLSQALRERVVWLDRLPEKPLTGVVVANEVLDALPCERFIVRGGEITELAVEAGVGPRAFKWREVPARETLAAEVRSIGASLPHGFPVPYLSEVCTRVAPWIRSVAQCLELGAILLFDYGLPRAHYYHPQRDGGTLRCHFRQRAHDDPLINAGVQDITAWVDFTRVAEAADEAGLQVSGWTSQAGFLLGTGIDRLMSQGSDVVARARWASEAQKLMLPGEMGEVFKAMALTRGYEVPLQGFAIQDLRRSL